MQVLLNGRLVPENEAVVSVFDRSFQLGDGLFETICVRNGRPFRWNQHMNRLRDGATFLGIKLPFSTNDLSAHLARLIAANDSPEALLRLHVSRGVGRRGYSPSGADRPAWVMSLHPLPAVDPEKPLQRKVITSAYRLDGASPLNRFKTASRMLQIMARIEADAANADEAILLSAHGHVLETTAANVFWVEGDTVCRVPSDQGVLPGITQALVVELCQQAGISVTEKLVAPDQMKQCDGCFLTLTSVGIAEIVEWDGKSIRQSALVRQLFDDYGRALRRECAA